jgi:hypothetical protein
VRGRPEVDYLNPPIAESGRANNAVAPIALFAIAHRTSGSERYFHTPSPGMTARIFA